MLGINLEVEIAKVDSEHWVDEDLRTGLELTHTCLGGQLVKTNLV
jgi:hypothetical protein